MKVVTIEEARENLSELLQFVARGQQVVIADGGKWAAMLGPAPLPPTPEEEAAAVEKRKEIVRSWVRDSIAAGHPPEPDSPLWELFEERSGPG